MSEDRSDLETRVDRLERMVEELVTEVRQSRGGGERTSAGPDEAARTTRPGSTGTGPAGRSAATERPAQPRWEPPPAAPRPSLSEWMEGQGERWLGRIGIAFLILAVAFLLKLGSDRGWITPLFRLALGGGIGTALLVVGLRVEPKTRRLGQVLLGGSIAVFYLVGWAGFALYDLIPFVIAFSLMATTTVLAIALAERQDAALLAVVGVSGGLATPFLLDTGSGNVIALAAYAALVLMGGGAVQYHRGWKSLLGTMNFGGALVLIAVSVGLGDRSPLVPLLAVAAFWIVCGLSPTLRPALHSDPDGGGPPPRHDLLFRRLTLFSSTPITALVIAAMFELSGLASAAVWIGVAAVLAYIGFEYRERPRVGAAAAEAAALAGLIGLWVWPGNDTSIFFVAAASAGLLILHQRKAPGRLDAVAHLSFVVGAVVFLAAASDSLLDGVLGLRVGTFPRLGAVIMAAVASLWLASTGRARSLYRAGAYLALLIWAYSTLDPLSNGAALVSIAWTLQGAVALLPARRRRSQALQLAGLGTIVLVAAKMLIVDLSDMDPVWRILLFMGFGVGLLGLAWISNRPGAMAPDGGANSD